MRKDDRDPLSGTVIESAIAVHRVMGPGLLESVYRPCLEHELAKRGLVFVADRKLPVVYDGRELNAFLRLDLLVEDSLVVELKSVAQLHPIHTAQVLTYLRLSGHHRALLLNFNVLRMIDGVRRLVV